MSGHLLTAYVAASAAVAICLFRLYQLWNGPLSHLPGPFSTRFTGIRNRIHQLRGSRIYYLKELHDKYGPIVRISPKEASVADLEATREIHKTAGGYLKSDFYDNLSATEERHMFTTRDPTLHSDWRKLLAPAMSESSIKTVQSTVDKNVDLLISQLAGELKTKGYMDVYKWAHFFATDVIGELSFGESFRMLETGQVNQYIKDLLQLGKLRTLQTGLLGRPLYEVPNLPIWPIRTMYNLRDRLISYSEQSLDRYRNHMALSPENPKPMLFSRIMGEKGAKVGLTNKQITVQAQGFLIAGTDTTANTLTMLIWCILTHADVRSEFMAAIADLPENPTNDDIKHIPIIDKMLDETLRIYGAAPTPLPRSVPKGGRNLAGYFIPEGLTVSPVSHVLHRDPSIFPDPEAWKPERWTNATDDMKHAFTAFGGGSRVCIGLHLARMEMRLAVVAFFKKFPNAQPALGVEGFSVGDMHMLDFFLMKLQGNRCLVK